MAGAAGGDQVGGLGDEGVGARELTADDERVSEVEAELGALAGRTAVAQARDGALEVGEARGVVDGAAAREVAVEVEVV